MVKNMAEPTDTKNLRHLATGSVVAMFLSAGLMGNAAFAQRACKHLTRSYLISVMDGRRRLHFLRRTATVLSLPETA